MNTTRQAVVSGRPGARRFGRVVIFIGVTQWLSGCATLSESECRAGNWYDIGARDGYAGYSRDRLASHREACKEYRIAPDVAAYQQGYAEGLQRFCTPERGYEYGRQGGSYGGVCPAAVESDFLRAYRAGREIYNLEERLKSLQREIDDKEEKLRKTDPDNRDRRARLRREIERLDDDRRDLRRQLDWADRPYRW